MSVACCVYAIVACDMQPPPGLTGLGDGTLSMVASGSLAGVTSPVPSGGLRPMAENVLRHGAIVEALQRQGPTLPVRFGTVVADALVLTDVLAQRQAELLADLTRLGDKVEFGLTVLWDRSPGEDDGLLDGPDDHQLPGGGPGTQYLRARLAASHRDATRREAARSIARSLDAVLDSHVLDRRCSITPTDRLAVRAAYLIDPTQFGACTRAIGEVRRRRQDLRVLVSGPWAPYSFVSPDRAGERSPLDDVLKDASRWWTPSANG